MSTRAPAAVIALVSAMFLVGKPTSTPGGGHGPGPEGSASPTAHGWRRPRPPEPGGSAVRGGDLRDGPVKTSMWSPAWLEPAFPGRN